MMRTHVPGIHIPDSVIARMKGAQDQTREGLNLCVDLIQEVRTIKGVSGVHLPFLSKTRRVSLVRYTCWGKDPKAPGPL